MVDWINRENAPSDSEGDEECEEEAKSRAEGQAGMEVEGKGVDGVAGEAQEQILGKIDGDLTQQKLEASSKDSLFALFRGTFSGRMFMATSIEVIQEFCL